MSFEQLDQKGIALRLSINLIASWLMTFVTVMDLEYARGVIYWSILGRKDPAYVPWLDTRSMHL